MRRADIEVPNLAVDVNSWARSACYPRGSFCPISHGLSTQHRRITWSAFRPCSACWPYSQAPLCPCTPQVISIHLEGTFERLRYLLGGDRPSQTAHLARSSAGAELEPKSEKGGISTTAPSPLAWEVQSLPPILHIPDPSPVPSYSKAPRGLFVLLRETRIFTGHAISPSPSLRQYPGRDAIPAGRNLPDKGLRYLRTVIVTAAVHRGFSSKLLPTCVGMTFPLNLPALGRRQPLYLGLPLGRDLCFC